MCGYYDGTASRFYRRGDVLSPCWLICRLLRGHFLEFYIIDEGLMWDQCSEILGQLRRAVKVKLAYDDSVAA